MKIILGKVRPLSGHLAKAHPQVLIIAPGQRATPPKFQRACPNSGETRDIATHDLPGIGTLTVYFDPEQQMHLCDPQVSEVLDAAQIDVLVTALLKAKGELIALS